MADYNIIADIGNLLISNLRSGLVPGVMQSAESIALCTEDGDFVLCLTLYDIEILSRGLNKDNSFSVPIGLKYILAAKSKANDEIKALDEHRILGKAISILSETPVIKNESGFLSNSDMPVEITMDDICLDEKIKICNHVFGAFRTSVFYSAAPVFIDSGFTVGKAARVFNG